jgi:SAM-dependent methyltransferase
MDPLAYYRDLLAKYGPTYQAVDAGSEYTHGLRLKILSEIIKEAGVTILDVGCGLGDLVNYAGAGGTYRGIDVIPEMIDAARLKYPCYSFEVGDIANPKPEWKADYVVASGLFQFPCPWLTILLTMYGLCRKGVAVNFLRRGAKAELTVSLEGVAYEAEQISPYFTIRADYLPNDFTLYLWKERPT